MTKSRFLIYEVKYKTNLYLQCLERVNMQVKEFKISYKSSAFACPLHPMVKWLCEEETLTRNSISPSVNYRNNSSLVLSNALENRLRKIKMKSGRVTPTTWWAEISGSDHNGPWKTPSWVIHTLNLIACTTTQPIIEQSCA